MGYGPNVLLDATYLGNASATPHPLDQTNVVTLALPLRDTAIANQETNSAVLDNLEVVSDWATISKAV